MEELVDSGKVRFIGVSNFALRELKSAQRAMTRHSIVSNQVRYNLIDRTIELGLLSYCQEHDITVIAHSPLSSGFAIIKARDPGKVIERIAQASSRTQAQVVLNWCISKRGVVTIPKSNSVDRVKENCGASSFELSGEELELLETEIRFRRRGNAEVGLRRIARYICQRLGREQ
jgi:diketogulonate reductase-like aldo/keto reductase